MRAVTLQSQELKKLNQVQAEAAQQANQLRGRKGRQSHATLSPISGLPKGLAPKRGSVGDSTTPHNLKQAKSLAQMHGNFRQILKQTAKEQYEKRKQQTQEREKHEKAVRRLHHITRKVPPRADTAVTKPKEKEKNYLNFRQSHGAHEHTLLKKMVHQELEHENKELLDLAERVGYLDPNRAATQVGFFPSSFDESTKNNLGGGDRRFSRERPERGDRLEASKSAAIKEKARLMGRANKAHKTMDGGFGADRRASAMSQDKDFFLTEPQDPSSPEPLIMLKKPSLKGVANRMHQVSKVNEQMPGSRKRAKQDPFARTQQTMKHRLMAANNAVNLKSTWAKTPSNANGLARNGLNSHSRDRLNTSQSQGQVLRSQFDLRSSMKQTKRDIYSFFHRGQAPPSSQKSQRRQFQQRNNQVKFLQTAEDISPASHLLTPKMRFEQRNSDFGTDSQVKSSSKPGSFIFASPDPSVSNQKIIRLKRTFVDQQMQASSSQLEGINQKPLLCTTARGGSSFEKREENATSLQGLQTAQKSHLKSYTQYPMVKSTDSNASLAKFTRHQNERDDLFSSRQGRTSQATTAMTPSGVLDRPSQSRYNRSSVGEAKPWMRVIERKRNTSLMGSELDFKGPQQATQNHFDASRNVQGHITTNTKAIPVSKNKSLAILAARERESAQPQSTASLLTSKQSVHPKRAATEQLVEHHSTKRPKNKAKSSAYLQKIQENGSGQQLGLNNLQSLESETTSLRLEEGAGRQSAAKPRPSMKQSSQGSALRKKQGRKSKMITPASLRETGSGQVARKRSRETIGLPDKGKMREERENELARKHRFQDFMHRMAIGFQKWIFGKLNETSYENKQIEVDLKQKIKTRQKVHNKRLEHRHLKTLDPTIESSFDSDAAAEDSCNSDNKSPKERNDLYQWLRNSSIKHAKTSDPVDLTKLVAEAQASIAAKERGSETKSEGSDSSPRRTAIEKRTDSKETLEATKVGVQTTKHVTISLVDDANKGDSERQRGGLQRKRTLNRGSTFAIMPAQTTNIKISSPDLHATGVIASESNTAKSTTAAKKRSLFRKGESLVQIQSLESLRMQKELSFNSASTSALVKRIHETEDKKQSLSMFKQNLIFIQRVRAFRDQVWTWTQELCKDKDKRDFDAMAKLISDFEQGDGSQTQGSVLGWAMGRLKNISPTINAAEKKLNGVIEAVNYKYKRMMNFVLEKHDFKQNDFREEIGAGSPIIDYESDEEANEAVQNINYVHQKLEGVKELIVDKMHESLQAMFEAFVREYSHNRNPLFENKLIFYCLLKTEGDLMIELGDYDKAIKAYKALRNYCRVWGNQYLPQEMWMAEQIGVAYRELRYHELAVDFFKTMLSLAWELNDNNAEMRSYDHLSTEYYYIGNISKARLYHERVFQGRSEDPNSTAKHASCMLNNYKRTYVEAKYKFDQQGLKGVSAEDRGKRANFGEYSHNYNYLPQEEVAPELLDEKELKERKLQNLKFEEELRRDTENRVLPGQGLMDQNPFGFKDINSMGKHEKILEQHKRAARRNFFLGSKVDKEKVRERYKPANLKVVNTQKTFEKAKPFSETEFRVRIRESVNKLHAKEKGRARRGERPKERATNMLKNCRQYLDFMESYILDAVKEQNKINASINNASHAGATSPEPATNVSNSQRSTSRSPSRNISRNPSRKTSRNMSRNNSKEELQQFN